MPQALLKWLRFITPGIIIIVYAYIVGAVTGYWNIPYPDDLKQGVYLIPFLVLGSIYYVLPLRDAANKKYFEEVTENLRKKMVLMCGLEDDPEKYTWKKLRRIFYNTVDKNESLKTKASLAYFNGYIWTTFADARALAFIFAVAMLPFSFFDVRLLFSSVGFVCLALVTIPASNIVTKFQKRIGDQQIEIMQEYHLEEIRDRLNNVV